ncbi:hypothetical protein LCGC14_2784000 [marine sediment metagenome]|uniref:Uncharacterized protein n=1 Tax=marine sediment metagenome TaxID=412755 RepID=A0A0F8YSH8_9ZZZZ
MTTSSQPETPEQVAKRKAAEALPCKPMSSSTLAVCLKRVDGTVNHVKACPAAHRPAVSAAMLPMVDALDLLRHLADAAEHQEGPTPSVSSLTILQIVTKALAAGEVKS